MVKILRMITIPSMVPINCPAGESNTLLHHQIKGLALAQCPVFSLSMQIYLLSDSLSYPQRVSYYLTLFNTGLTYYFHDIGYPIIYPIVTFAYRKVKNILLEALPQTIFIKHQQTITDNYLDYITHLSQKTLVDYIKQQFRIQKTFILERHPVRSWKTGIFDKYLRLSQTNICYEYRKLYYTVLGKA